MFGSVFCRFSANLDPQDPSRSQGLTLLSIGLVAPLLSPTLPSPHPASHPPGRGGVRREVAETRARVEVMKKSPRGHRILPGSRRETLARNCRTHDGRGALEKAAGGLRILSDVSCVFEGSKRAPFGRPGFPKCNLWAPGAQRRLPRTTDKRQTNPTKFLTFVCPLRWPSRGFRGGPPKNTPPGLHGQSCGTQSLTYKKLGASGFKVNAATPHWLLMVLGWKGTHRRHQQGDVLSPTLEFVY